MNPLLLTDFYKIGHPFQYPEGTTLVYSNLTPRKSRINGVDTMVWVGLQKFIKKYLIDYFNTYFFHRPLEVVMEEYKALVEIGLGGPLKSYKHIEDLHKLGYLPIKIEALPEGSTVPMRVPVLTIYNTVPEFYWITNFLETLMSCELWQSCTSATLAREYRKILNKWAEKTGMPKEFVNFQAHDFSMRGMSSLESAINSGIGHLLFFSGTDTIPAILALQEYYNAQGFIGGSIPATEHSVMCAGGKEDELETYRRLIEDVYPSGLVSIVSDTWNLWDVLTKHNVALKDKIMARDGKVVFRPDSGDPVDIICGLPEGIYEGESTGQPNIDWANTPKNRTPVEKGVIELLWDVFGGIINEKGYKVLDSHVGVIYGDSITLDRAEEICKRLEAKGFASQCVLGVGSYTYQYNTRDTLGFAVKATYVEREENFLATSESLEWGSKTIGCPIFKDPITDDGTKKSAKGLIRVVKEDGKFVMKDEQMWEQLQTEPSAFVPFFEDGVLLVNDSLETIRKRAQSYGKKEKKEQETIGN